MTRRKEAEQYAVYAVNLEILRADRDRLASLLEKLRPYLRHNGNCARVLPVPIDAQPPVCTCGLADLLTEMERP